MDIIDAAETGNVAKITSLLNKGANINQINEIGWTALMSASKYSNDLSSLDTVKLLLDRGADIHIQSHKGWTALMLASSYSGSSSSLETVELLLDRGANVNVKNIEAFTPLMLAARYSKIESSLETVELLLDRGADINATENNGWTSLMLAARHSNDTSSLETVKLLLDRGASINVKQNTGWTALLLAVYNSHTTSSLETVKLLLDRGADVFDTVGDFGENAIDFCVTRKCKDLVAKYVWKSLYKRDKDLAKTYSLQNNLPQDIWKIILLNKRQKLLCSTLNSNKNKEILILFATELNIPINVKTTKAELCSLISKQLATGRWN